MESARMLMILVCKFLADYLINPKTRICDMKIAPFTIEQYFARYEFTTPYLLCASDCETITVAELLALAGRDLTELGPLRLGYTESQGNLAFRTAVSRLYPAIHPDTIVELGAPEEGIYLAMRALLEPGDHVIALTPAYDSLINLAEHISGHVSKWWLQATPDGWQLDLAELERLITPETRLIIVNFPHNPTGFLPTQAEFEAIMTLARQHNIWLFCDEMYRGLELQAEDQLPSAAELYDRAVVLSGLSKTYGLPGLRTGWLIVQDSTLREELINWKHYTTICPAAPSEFLATAALSVANQLRDRNRRLIQQNLAAADAFFARWPDLFIWRRPLAGSVALVELKQISATEYCHHLAQTAGILLLPSSCLGYGDSHVRLGVGRADFSANLDRYEQYLCR